VCVWERAVYLSICVYICGCFESLCIYPIQNVVSVSRNFCDYTSENLLGVSVNCALFLCVRVCDI